VRLVVSTARAKHTMPPPLATIFSDEDKMNALAKKYGGKDGIVSFYLFFQPGVW